MKISAVRVVLLAAVAGLLPSKLAFADAVPPPPLLCLPGEVGITSHRGPQCVPRAPTDCAPGYRGVIGGDCLLAACTADQQCTDGLRCRQVDTCQELRELRWTGWSWSPGGGAFNSRMKELPRPEGPAPKAWVTLHICGQDGACNAPAECRPMGLCYPTRGDPKAKVSSGPPSVAPLPAGVMPEIYVAEQPRKAASGCRRGCTVSATATHGSWLSALLVAATLLARRRRA